MFGPRPGAADNQLDEEEDPAEDQHSSASDLDESSGSKVGAKGPFGAKMVLVEDLVADTAVRKKEDPRKDFVDKFFKENLAAS